MNFQLAAIGHSFTGSMAYYLHDKRPDSNAAHPTTAERVAWTETRNLATDGPQTATRIMIATAKSADALKAAAGVKTTGRKATAGPVFAFSLAWHPDEAADLTREQMTAAADRALKILGLDQQQAVLIAHSDTKHPHLHVVVNRVHPETGKAASIAAPNVRTLDRWAAEYERERGQIVSPNREVKYQRQEEAQRQHLDRDERKAFVDRQKAEALPKPLTEAQILRDLSAAQAAKHKAAWPALSAWHKGAKDAIYRDAAKRLATLNAQHKALTRPLWAQHFRDERTQAQAFEKRERDFAGRVANALAAAKEQMRRGQAPGRGLLSLTFANVFSVEARRASFAAQQDARRLVVVKQLRAAFDTDAAAIKAQRCTTLAGQREAFSKARTDLIDKQGTERAKIREAWSQLYVRRGRDPEPMQRTSREQQPMREDFDKAKRLAQANPPPHPTERQHVSNPSPTPSPAGTVPMTARTVQDVPKQPDLSKAVQVSPSVPKPTTDWEALHGKAPTVKTAPKTDWSKLQNRLTTEQAKAASQKSETPSQHPKPKQ